MKISFRTWAYTAIGLTLFAAGFSGQWAVAKSYPDHAIRLIVPYGPGGPTDVLARLVAEHMGRALKESIIVMNKPGGGGVVAMMEVTRSASDGYTLLLGDINLSVSPALHKSLPFNPEKSFTSIGFVATAPMLVLVSQSSPLQSIKDLVAQAKAHPGSLSYAHGGIGSPTHLGPEVFKARLGLDITPVPYKSSGEALTAVAGGHGQLVFTGLSAAQGLIDSGKLKPIAITGLTRSVALPSVPTLAEEGVPLPELDVGSWWGLLGPPNMSPAITHRLHAALQEALQSPEFSDRLKAINFSAGSGTPQELQTWIRNETEVWPSVLEGAGIVPE